MLVLIHHDVCMVHFMHMLFKLMSNVIHVYGVEREEIQHHHAILTTSPQGVIQQLTLACLLRTLIY